MIDRRIAPPISGYKKVALHFPEPVMLRNGIPVWVVGDGDDEVNRLDVLVGGGAYQEQKPLLAYLAGMLCFEGNANMSAEAISEAFDYYGALKSAQPHDHCTMLSVSSLNHTFVHIADILRGCMQHPTYSPAECALYQQCIASNLATAMERVDYLASVELKRMYYGKHHPGAKEVTPDGVKGITGDDLKQFHQQYYHADNVRIVFSGKVTDREMKILDSTLGAWDNHGMKVDESVVPEIQSTSEKLSIIDKPEALQSAIEMCIPAVPRRHPDYFKLRLLVTAFGGYFGSRLNMNIREDKGYTYGIHAMLLGKSHEAVISIYSSCATDHTWKLIDEVKHEMARLREELMSEAELHTVKQHMLSELMKTLDTPFSKARYVGDWFTCGVYPEYFNNQVDAIMECRAEDVREMAQKYLLDDKILLAIAGDKEKIALLRKN